MPKIVSITCRTDTQPAAVPAHSQTVDGNGRSIATRGSDSRPRGILVQFPKVSQGPLYAAAVAAAILTAVPTVIV